MDQGQMRETETSWLWTYGAVETSENQHFCKQRREGLIVFGTFNRMVVGSTLVMSSRLFFRVSLSHLYPDAQLEGPRFDIKLRTLDFFASFPRYLHPTHILGGRLKTV